jgi:hypothetical protein
MREASADNARNGSACVVSYAEFLANVDRATDGNATRIRDALRHIAGMRPGCQVVVAGGLVALCLRPTAPIESGTAEWRAEWLDRISQESPDVDLWLVNHSEPSDGDVDWTRAIETELVRMLAVDTDAKSAEKGRRKQPASMQPRSARRDAERVLEFGRDTAY